MIDSMIFPDSANYPQNFALSFSVLTFPPIAILHLSENNHLIHVSMNTYKFTDEEMPYGILEEFGLTREMIDDLPLCVLQDIYSGRRSPVLPIQTDDTEGNTVRCRTRFALVRREDGTVDVLFYPVLEESRLERFSEENKRRLTEGKAVIGTLTTDDGKQVQAFHQIDPDTRQILSVPTPVIGRNLQIIADEFHLSNAEINCLRAGEPLTVADGDDLMTIGIDLTEPTGLLVCGGDSVQWKKASKKEWEKYNFGCFGCWAADEAGNLNYIHEEDYSDEMWNELKKSSRMKAQNSNFQKL